MKVYHEGYNAAEDKSYIDQFEIGEINFNNELINEQEIGNKNTRPNFKKKIGPCKVEVYGGEGSIPHFHIIGVNSDFQSCICIYSPNYFSHGGKYKDTFNSSQRDILIKWFSSLNNLFKVYTNWEVIEKVWTGSNPECKFPENKKSDIQPDYSNMTQFKD